MHRFSAVLLVVVGAGLGALFMLSQNEVELMVKSDPVGATSTMSGATVATAPSPVPLPLPLAHPPAIVRALYLTSWSAGTPSRIAHVLDMVKRSEANAVVIDIKDYSGIVAYKTTVPEVIQYGASERRIADVDTLIRTLHENNIYVIARISAFQDGALAHARPDVAVKLAQGSDPAQYPIWEDRKGLSWVDPSSREVWKYLVAIGKDIRAHGFDELNFDYIRFPTDGNLGGMYFPAWDKTKEKHEVIRSFFAYLRAELQGIPISADLFGLSTVAEDDMGIGQIIEDAYEYFDFVSPMVYPSHYANGFQGYAHPAQFPYEVIAYSLTKASQRLNPPSPTGTSTPTLTPRVFNAKVRPWLQDFDLGADYTPPMIHAQIRATRDTLKDGYVGYMLWNPSNRYEAESIIE